MIALLSLLASITAQDAALPAVARTMEFALERSEEARALGHYGSLVVHARIGEGGSLGDLQLARSSGSDRLDADALAKLEGASIRGSQPGDLVAFDIDYLPFDIERIPAYSCRQAALDLGWWQSLSPDNTPTNSSIYNMLSGLLLVATIDTGSSADVAGRYKAFRANFGTAVARCQDRPDASFLATAVKAD